jgi:hypothetical protein
VLVLVVFGAVAACILNGIATAKLMYRDRLPWLLVSMALWVTAALSFR